MTLRIQFSSHLFHPVIRLPKSYEVYDFTQGYDPNRKRSSPYGIGKYNEVRKGMYETPLFEGLRNIHMGIDIAAPVGENIYSFFRAKVHSFAYHSSPGDYGNTLITESEIDGVKLYALYGHLSASSLEGKKRGQKIDPGQVIASVGDRHENGGWNPHLHFQLSYEEPKEADLPGAVSQADRAWALNVFPDPRLVLGNLYT